MNPIRCFRLLALAAATLFMSFEGVLAQNGGRPGGGGTGRPSFPPGLHDRTLPPGRPFNPPDEFNPPGRGGGPGNQEDLQSAAERLTEILDDESFPNTVLLPEAVDHYNVLALAVRDGTLQRAPAVLIAGRQILPEALGQEGVLVAGTLPVSATPGELPPLLPGGTQQFLTPLSDWTIPGMSAATPLGFGAEWGSVWAGASYQNQLRYGTANDGAVAVGFGVGDATKYVGLQVGVISFSTVRSGFGERMGIDLHLHRRFGELWSVAVGVESFAADYDITQDSDKNVYAVGSRWLGLRSNPDAPFGLAMVTLGVGSGRFQTNASFENRENGVGAFGSFGVRVLQPLSLISEWTGQDLTLAASVTPLRDQDVAITAGFADVTGAAGDGARFVIGGSVGLRFR